MVNPDHSVTEVNDSRLKHLLVPDAEHAVYVPKELVGDLQKTGFLIQEHTPAEIIDAVARVVERLPDDHRWKAALNQAIADLGPDDEDPA
jgi:hypothetical protein